MTQRLISERKRSYSPRRSHHHKQKIESMVDKIIAAVVSPNLSSYFSEGKRYEDANRHEDKYGSHARGKRHENRHKDRYAAYHRGGFRGRSSRRDEDHSHSIQADPYGQGERRRSECHERERKHRVRSHSRRRSSHHDTHRRSASSHGDRETSHHDNTPSDYEERTREYGAIPAYESSQRSTHILPQRRHSNCSPEYRSSNTQTSCSYAEHPTPAQRPSPLSPEEKQAYWDKLAENGYTDAPTAVPARQGVHRAAYEEEAEEEGDGEYVMSGGREKKGIGEYLMSGGRGKQGDGHAHVHFYR